MVDLSCKFFQNRARSNPRPSRTSILKNPRNINMRTSKLILFGIKTSLCLAFCAGLAVPVFAQKKLNVVALTVGDLGNPFFVQIAHGAQAAAKKINPGVKFQSEFQQL